MNLPENDTGRSLDRFWLCSLAEPEGPIDFTQGASSRASDLLLLIALFWQCRKVQNLTRTDFDSLMDRSDNASSGFDLKLCQCVGRTWNSETSIAARILKSQEQDFRDTGKCWEVVRSRINWLWRAVTG